MIYLVNNNNSCFFNHAVEEYLMEKFDDEIFMLWINKPAILIGRNQNTISEINLDYVRKNGIEVVRRLSGGGTVYNDLGNINYTFISKRDGSREEISSGFKRFASPVINALRSLGVEAVFTGRNDITIDGRKFSGNAQYFQKDKLLHHGTLLFDCDMDKLALALKSRPIKFKDKSVKSVASRVTNILPHLKEPMSIVEFKEYLEKFIIDEYGIKRIYQLGEKDIYAINKISQARFESWEWNYGMSPKYQYNNMVKYLGGVVEYGLNVEGGVIRDISIYGDFFGERDIGELELILKGSRHTIDDLDKALETIDLEEYIKGVSVEEFIEGLLDIK